MRILVVEDEPKTIAFVREGLEASAFAVDTASRGDEGLLLARTRQYDLVVLDIMLPHRDGWEILSDLRARGNAVPVLFLTARDAVEDRVRGLQLGADDYLVKPFAFAELLARVNALLRRAHTSTSAPEEIMVGGLRLDLLLQRVVRDEREIALTAKEFALLALLAHRAGEVLSRGDIAQTVWGLATPADSRVLDVAVRRLRRKVDDPFPTKLIHTVRGVGYVLEPR